MQICDFLGNNKTELIAVTSGDSISKYTYTTTLNEMKQDKFRLGAQALNHHYQLCFLNPCSTMHQKYYFLFVAVLQQKFFFYENRKFTTRFVLIQNRNPTLEL